MNVSLNWLKDYVNVPDDVKAFADAMTMTGTKVEGYSVTGSDIEKVKSIILDTVKTQPAVLNEPETFVGVVAQNESSVDFVCRAWVNSADYWTVYFALMEGVKKAFDSNGIEIPFPQMDVHIKND